MPGTSASIHCGRSAQGFTVIEMAVAVVVVAMLLGSLLVPLQTQVEESQVREAEKALARIKEALAGFASANGYLPCPDIVTSNDGAEDASAGSCSGIVSGIAYGNVPWATLGLPDTTDPWGNRYRYAVVENFARRSPDSSFSLSTTVSKLRICTSSACTSVLNDNSTSPAPSVLAVVLSHGRNGWGAINSRTNTANAAPSSADEIENTDTGGNFVYRARSGLGSSGGEFDDVVAWLSRFTLVNQMIAAGKLP